MSRHEFTAKTKRQIRERAGNRCEHCGTDVGPFECNHKLDCWRGGGNDVGNGELLCKAVCHPKETAKQAAARAKVNRVTGRTKRGCQYLKTNKHRGKLKGRPFQKGHRPLRARKT